jgi:hypothetical protein
MSPSRDHDGRPHHGLDGGYTRRRFTLLLSKATAGTVGLVGGLISFTPTPSAFATIEVGNGVCEPFEFLTNQENCTGPCTTDNSCCYISYGFFPGNADYVCCEYDIVNSKIPKFQMHLIQIGPPPISGVSDLVAWACCTSCL